MVHVGIIGFQKTLNAVIVVDCTASQAIANITFSEIVKVAKDFGYTEPDPKDDLNGMDVARKFNYHYLWSFSWLKDLDVSTLNVENIVPESLIRTVATAEEFKNKLPSFDKSFCKK
ncbi:hypothetical protein BD770DRAFT_425830 [Pilaira anomala]|nr:hypothetical protein BD770DRAFT_425830 [Pilaira anomala]